MTYEQALEEMGDIDDFCIKCCNRCTGNDWYCPSPCDMLEKARQLDYSRLVKCYARHEGDLNKVSRYISQAKVYGGIRND